MDKFFVSEADIIKDTVYDIVYTGENKEEASRLGAEAIAEFDAILTILHHQGITREKAYNLLFRTLKEAK